MQNPDNPNSILCFKEVLNVCLDLTKVSGWKELGKSDNPCVKRSICEIAKARVNGFQWNLWENNSVLACAKHWVAYGLPQAGRDYAPVDMSERTLFDTYLPPFKACIDAGVLTFMSAFNT